MRFSTLSTILAVALGAAAAPASEVDTREASKLEARQVANVDVRRTYYLSMHGFNLLIF
jgi:predicted lipoprotein